MNTDNAPEREIVLPQVPEFLLTNLCSSMQEWAEADRGDAAEEIFEHVVRRFGGELRAYARTAILADREAGARAGQGEAKAWLKYPPKKPELARSDRYPELTDNERGRGWVSEPLYPQAAAAQPPTHAASPDVVKMVSELKKLVTECGNASFACGEWSGESEAGDEEPARSYDSVYEVHDAARKRLLASIDALGAAATQASSAVGAEGRESDQQLMRFYSVETISALIDAQERHITKLQAKIPPLRDELPRNPRIG